MLKSVANSDMKDESILRKGEMTFSHRFTFITKLFKLYLLQNQYISNSCFPKCQYIPGTLMQKNNTEIIGNDMRIK